MSTTPEAQRLEEWLVQFDEGEQERIIQYALDHVLPNLKSRRLAAQPTKLSIQSLWPFQPGGGIDPRSELAKEPAQPVARLTDERILDLATEKFPHWRYDIQDRFVLELARSIESELAARSVPDSIGLANTLWAMAQGRGPIEEVTELMAAEISRASVPEVPAAPSELSMSMFASTQDYERAIANQALPAAVDACEHSSGQDWQPIETAPVAKAVLLLWRPVDHEARPYHREVIVGSFCYDSATYKQDGRVWSDRYYDVATHILAWMPCPSAQWPPQPGQQGRMPAAAAAGSDVTKAALKVIKDRDDFGWCREVDDAIDALRVALSKNSAARKGGEAE